MKYTTTPVGTSVIAETEEKVNVLRAAYPRKTVQPVLVTNIKPGNELLVAGYFGRCIGVEELY